MNGARGKKHRFVSADDFQCHAMLVEENGFATTCWRKLTDPVHDLQREGEGDDAFVTVSVSREMMEILSNGWSEPVSIMIVPPPPGRTNHEMIAMTHECEKSA